MSSSRTQSFMFLLESMTTYITICVMYPISKTCIYHGASTSLLQRQEIKVIFLVFYFAYFVVFLKGWFLVLYILSNV
jgi:hypothetical protein